MGGKAHRESLIIVRERTLMQREEAGIGKDSIGVLANNREDIADVIFSY